jgi:hypothetical protein
MPRSMAAPPSLLELALSAAHESATTALVISAGRHKGDEEGRGARF